MLIQRYINIDAGYLIHERDAKGNLQVNATKFPDGMKAVADTVHSLGMKLGVYTDIGVGSCGQGPGSGGHYAQDAQTFASWGVDYLKVDYCGPMPAGVSQWSQWAALRDALNATGRPIYYSICPKTVAPNEGTASPFAGKHIYSPPGNWTRNNHTSLANSWLVEYVNNVDTWYSTQDCMNAGAPCGVITNVDAVLAMTNLSYSGPGGWNDADMLQVCNEGAHSTGMTRAAYLAEFAIWSVLGSPLILSADLRKSASAEMRACLADVALKAEVIAVNQDGGGRPARLVAQEPETAPRTSTEILSQVLTRPLGDGAAAVVLFNRRQTAASMSVTWLQLGWSAGTVAHVRDLWAQSDVGKFQDGYNVTVDAQAAVMVRITPA